MWWLIGGAVIYFLLQPKTAPTARAPVPKAMSKGTVTYGPPSVDAGFGPASGSAEAGTSIEKVGAGPDGTCTRDSGAPCEALFQGYFKG